ncbi:hypothetical protein Goklo_008103 [Gossypium klotzschianum]|uniref:Aminotransferase-like plant mobile domain-containing protein n=1 Tax=Gossypium klotzschianum TaxID=34286 RepID=A0A7J8UYY9_9ROSI|nr:hypothetical protein [Gossypium klotzschianum]
MQTFHFPCGTITLEDVQIQLGLPMDGPVMTRLVTAMDWRDVYEQLLGRVSETIYGARIDMNLLKRNFGGLDGELSKVQKVQHARKYIDMIIEGLLMPNKSRNLVHLRWLLKLMEFKEVGELSWGVSRVSNIVSRDAWNHELSYLGLLEKLQDIWILLDQRSEVEHVKLPLVVYATVEIYESNRVMRKFHAEYINLWNNRYQDLPTREVIIAPESGVPVEMGPSSTLMQELTSMPAPPPVQYGSTYSGAFTNLIIFTQAPHLALHLSVSTLIPSFIFGSPPPSLTYYMPVPLTFQMMIIMTMAYKKSDYFVIGV